VDEGKASTSVVRVLVSPPGLPRTGSPGGQPGGVPAGGLGRRPPAV